MHSDMIGKIEKARQYAQEPERIQISSLKANFRGSNSSHVVTLTDGSWHCDSPSFSSWGISAHIIAMQKVLDRMLSPEAREATMPSGVHMHSEMVGKIEKARRYATEPARIEILELIATFHGSNSSHGIVLKNDKWSCDCAFFHSWGTCQHIMATQKMLHTMLTPQAREPDMHTGVHSEAMSL
jgi:hypothetical protein